MNEFSIDPEIEAYGTYGRLSSLVDYFEVAALNNQNYSLSEMGEAISDSGWNDIPISNIEDNLIANGSETTDETEQILADKTEDWKNALQNTIFQRSQELGEKYPFIIEDNRLVQKDFQENHAVYFKFLGISFLHARKLYSKFSMHDLSKIFEIAVTQCLSEKGLYSKNLGTASSSHGGFQKRLMSRISEVGIVSSESRLTKMRTKDCKVDTISGIFWDDGRNLNQHWVFLGQSTISISNRWESKMKEIDCRRWRGFLNASIDPQRFFSTPYHITDDYFHYLLEGDNGIILDRISLAKNILKINPDDKIIYEHLKNLGSK